MHSTTDQPALPATAYTDQAEFDREQEHIFAKTWQLVGHREQAADAGDYFVTSVAGEAIIVIRSDTGELHAHYNICPHRGSELLDGSGCARRISCPYHAWSFDQTGRLLTVMSETTFGHVDRDQHRLTSCRVEELHGLIFVNLDEGSRPLRDDAPWLEPALTHYSPDLPNLTHAHRTEVTIAANWKIAVENFSECYHCTVLHKSFVTGVADPDSYRIVDHGTWHEHGAVPHTGDRKAYAFDVNRTEAANEFRVWWMWPNFATQSYPGGVLHFWKWTPIDVTTTHVRVDWYFPSVDLEPWQRELIENHAETTWAEDPPIIEGIQRSMKSRAYRPGPILIDPDRGPMSEHGVASIQQLWRNAMHTP